MQLERVVGQLLHAADVYIEMWIFFLELIYSIGSDLQLATHTVLSKAARHCIRRSGQRQAAQSEMRSESIMMMKLEF